MASMDSHNAVRRLFRRCVVCPAQTPVCGTCDSGEICNLSTQSCDACPQTSCVKISATSPLPAPSGKANSDDKVNAGAIAGGVVGGVVAIVLLVFLVWKFCIQPRRQEYEDDSWPPEATPREKADSDAFTLRRDARASTHTVGARSIAASSILSRASNVIQIAYIPGVTNRSAPSTPGVLVPPVPPIPAQSPGASAATTPDHNQEQFMFLPGDIRGSTYSDMTEDRRSVAPSLLQRSSVATADYKGSVVDPLPAQTVIRAKAAVVSVKSSGANSPLDSPVSDVPPVPLIDVGRHAPNGNGRIPQRGDNQRSPLSPAFSVSSLHHNGTANTAKAMTAKPVRVVKSSNSNSSSSHRNLTPTSAPGPTSPDPTITGSSIYDPSRNRDSTLSNMTRGTHSRALHAADTASSVMDSDTEDEDPQLVAKKSLLHNTGGRRKSHLSNAIYLDEPSPFSDQQRMQSPSASSSSSSGSAVPTIVAPSTSSTTTTKPKPAQASGLKAGPQLSAVIEEATRRASRQPTHGGLGSVKRDNSPFSDAHEVKTVI